MHIQNNRLTLLSLSILLVLGLSACGATIGAGAGVAGYTAAQERTVGNAVDDTTITAKINSLYVQEDVNNLFNRVDVQVYEGRVLLTGRVHEPEHRKQAAQKAWQVSGVKEVINEIEVSKEVISPKIVAQDSWITTQVKAKLLADKQVRSINYNIDTVAGVVYIIGIAQDEAEMRQAMEVARHVKGVKKVVNHVRLKDSPLRVINQRS